jgi:hypothetical protein
VRHSVIASLRAQAGTTEASLWPTCLRCTEETSELPEGRRWVPVQSYSVDPQVFSPVALIGSDKQGTQVLRRDLNRPRKKGDRGWFTVIARCHGTEQTATIDVPLAWTTHHVFAAIQALQFFGADTKPEHGMRVIYGGRA